jgi:hypothetical protein
VKNTDKEQMKFIEVTAQWKSNGKCALHFNNKSTGNALRSCETLYCSRVGPALTALIFWEEVVQVDDRH